MPFLPFQTPVTDDEHWRNILHDLGAPPEIAPNSIPITEHEILNALNAGLYSASMGTYGSGTDGAVNFTTNANGNAFATYAANGANATFFQGNTTLQASSNTFTLTGDIFLGQSVAANGTVYYPSIASGVTINSNGFRIFCQGLLVNNGTIASNGTAAANNTAGTALSYTSTISGTTVGSAGGAGSTGTNNAGTGQSNCLGGAGGAGGNGNSHNGGAGGAATIPANVVTLPLFLPIALLGRTTAGSTTWSNFTAGCGGGSGGSDGSNNSGGGGGGAGIVMVAAQALSGNGTIAAVGGAGGAGGTGNGGGGGGGGGGLVIVVSRRVQSAGINPSGPLVYASGATTLANMTITAAGGAGGAGVGSGNNGSAGAAGNVILIPN